MLVWIEMEAPGIQIMEIIQCECVCSAIPQGDLTITIVNVKSKLIEPFFYYYKHTYRHTHRERFAYGLRVHIYRYGKGCTPPIII